MSVFKIKYILYLLLLVSCERTDINNKKNLSKDITAFEGIAMTVPYRIEIGRALKNKEFNDVETIIETTFDEVNRIYNKWNPHSEISKLNRLPAYKQVAISAELSFLLGQCDRFIKLSNGRFDPTIEPIQALWKKHLEANSIPSEEAIRQLRPAIGWDKIILQGNTFMKKHSVTAIDLGGIAKGYTVDLLIQRLRQAGHNSVFVEWGGEVEAIGRHPQGRNWAVYISNLDDLDPEHALAYVPLMNQAIATSGDYLQNWTVTASANTKIYFHVFDPKSLQPLLITDESIASSSVLANDCMTADVLATVLLMCPTIDEAKKLARSFQQEFPNSAYWLLSRKEIITPHDP